jgi:D-sedoheptulose 7-phosphate isomerase
MKPDLSAGPSGYLAEFSRLLERIEITTRGGERLPIDRGIASAIDSIVWLKEKDGKALLIGNGGSAAIVSHVHNDLCKSVGVRALVFNETPLLTAVANDHGYEEVFHRPVALWADRHDLLIAISSSGESENIVKAARLAGDKGCRLMTFTGFQPTNRLRLLGDLNVYVPASDYGYVEMAHSLVAHYITDMAAVRASAAVEVQN